MFTSIWNDLKRQFSYGNTITRIILVNIAVFVVIVLVLAFAGGFKDGDVQYSIVKYFSIHADWYFTITHPWVILTNMFFHISFGHIFWNMLLLYWFGRILGDLIGDHRILPLYILGGLFGAFIYFAYANFMGHDLSYAFGASAAVMAIILAAGVIAPDYSVNLILIGEVKLKFIVAVLLLLDLVGVYGMTNTGGHAAHLGGAFFGYMFATQLQNGNDWSLPVNKFVDKLTSLFKNINSSKKPGPRVAYKNPKAASMKKATKPHAKSDTNPSHQEHLDIILDKIKKTGYDSLSEEEKEFLFNASKK